MSEFVYKEFTVEDLDNLIKVLEKNTNKRNERKITTYNDIYDALMVMVHEESRYQHNLKKNDND